MDKRANGTTAVGDLPSSMVLSFIPGIHAGRPLKSLTVRHVRSIGALITVLTWTFGIGSPGVCAEECTRAAQLSGKNLAFDLA